VRFLICPLFAGTRAPAALRSEWHDLPALRGGSARNDTVARTDDFQAIWRKSPVGVMGDAVGRG